MATFDYQEVQALSSSVSRLKSEVVSKFMVYNFVVEEFCSADSLSGAAWSSAKNYMAQYVPISLAIFNALSNLERSLTNYLNDFVAIVGIPDRKIDMDQLICLYQELQRLESEKACFIEEQRIYFKHYSNYLGGLFPSSYQISLAESRIELLESFSEFDTNHKYDFSEFIDVIASIQSGLSYLGNEKHFQSGSLGYISIKPNNSSWYTKLNEFNKTNTEKNLPEPLDMTGYVYQTREIASNTRIECWVKEDDNGRITQETLLFNEKYNAWLLSMIEVYGEEYVFGKKEESITDKLSKYKREIKTGIDEKTGKELSAVEKLQKGSVITSYFVTSGIQLYWLGKYANATSGINKVDNSRSNNLNEYVMKEMVEGKTIKTAEDIRYEQYWLDVEAGKFDIPYNMNQQEYTQYLNGLSKVDTQLAINKINFGDVLRLRSEINLNSNVFFQGTSGGDSKSPSPQINDVEFNGDYSKYRSSGGGTNTYNVSDDALNHSSSGDFTYNPKTGDVSKMKGGGHGQFNIDILEENGMDYNITDTYENGVRVGNVPDHKTIAKRSGSNQAWFPESWSDADISSAGEAVANMPGNINTPDGVVIYGEYNGVRVGVIKTNGKIGTIFPDATQQP